MGLPPGSYTNLSLNSIGASGATFNFVAIRPASFANMFSLERITLIQYFVSNIVYNGMEKSSSLETLILGLIQQFIHH